MTVNGIEIANETIIRTRNYYAEIDQSCILSAINGEFKVNDLTGYIEWQNKCMRKVLNGDYDHTLAFLQQALFIRPNDSNSPMMAYKLIID